MAFWLICKAGFFYGKLGKWDFCIIKFTRIALRHFHFKMRTSTNSCSSAVLLLLLTIIIVGYTRFIRKLRAQTKQGFLETRLFFFATNITVRLLHKAIKLSTAWYSLVSITQNIILVSSLCDIVEKNEKFRWFQTWYII